jgi:hypothetical protein
LLKIKKKKNYLENDKIINIINFDNFGIIDFSIKRVEMF